MSHITVRSGAAGWSEMVICATFTGEPDVSNACSSVTDAHAAA